MTRKRAPKPSHELVLGVLDGPMSAGEVTEKLKKHMPKVSRASVKMILDELVEARDIGSKQSRFYRANAWRAGTAYFHHSEKEQKRNDECIHGNGPECPECEEDAFAGLTETETR